MNSEFGPVRLGAIQVLDAAFEQCAEEFYGSGPRSSRQMSEGAMSNVRAALVAALEAFDGARERCPSGPRGVVNQPIEQRRDADD